MSEALLVAVDCSTTACKAMAWDLAGRAVAEARRPIPLENPAVDGWEQDAERWWRAFVDALAELTGRLGSRAAQIEALTIAHQRETFVLTDEQALPLAPALVWMDARCRPDVARLVATLGAERIRELSGKPPCTTPSIYKLAYLLRIRPDLSRARPKLLDVHGLLVWRATGRFVTSLASADPLGLCDMRARAWSLDLCAAVGLAPEQLPALCEPGATIGVLRPAVALATGLPSGLPVLAGAGDGQAAGLGAGVTGRGRAYLNLGTAVVCGVASPSYRTALAYRTLFGLEAGSFFLESDMQGGTFLVDWLCDRLLGAPFGRRDGARASPSVGQGRATDEGARAALLARLGDEAAGLSPGADGLLVVPYWNGVMDPFWDDDASGITLGWRGTHGPAHLYRALLEGIAFEVRRRRESFDDALASGPDGRPVIEELVVLGGGAQSDLWCQILADVVGLPIIRAASPEATSLGVAMLAAASLGHFDSVRAASAAMARFGARFEPGPQASRYERIYLEVYRDLYPTLRASLARLAELRAERR